MLIERESVRCDDDIATLSELCTEGFIGIAGDADDLTLAEFELSSILMISNYSRRPAGPINLAKLIRSMPDPFDGICPPLSEELESSFGDQPRRRPRPPGSAELIALKPASLENAQAGTLWSLGSLNII